MIDRAASHIEKRRHPRTLVRMNLKGVRLDPDGGEVVDLLQMVDISRGGLGALSERALYPGQRFVLCLPLTDRNGRRNIYATVRRCEHVAFDGAYQVGLEFDSASAHECVGSSERVAA